MNPRVVGTCPGYKVYRWVVVRSGFAKMQEHPCKVLWKTQQSGISGGADGWPATCLLTGSYDVIGIWGVFFIFFFIPIYSLTSFKFFR